MINLGGYLTVLQLRVLNRLRVEGIDNLKSLPSRGVLLVSNHLTYYMDSIVVFHSVSYLRRPVPDLAAHQPLHRGRAGDDEIARLAAAV